MLHVLSKLRNGALELLSNFTIAPIDVGSVIDAGEDAKTLKLNRKPEPEVDKQTGRIALGDELAIYPLGVAHPELLTDTQIPSAARYLLVHVPSERKSLITEQECTTLIHYWRVLPDQTNFPSSLFELFFTPGAIH